MTLGSLFDALAFSLLWIDGNSFDFALLAVLVSPLTPVALVVATGALGWRGGALITLVVCALTVMLLAWIADSESSTAALGFLAGLLLLWVAALVAILIALWRRAMDEP